MVFNFVVAMLIPYAAAYLGTFLGILAPEEMKPGKKWLQAMEFFVFILILTVPISYLIDHNVTENTMLIAGITVVLFLARFFKIDTNMIFFLLAILLALAVGNTHYFTLLGVFMALYMIPVGALWVEPDAKKKTLLRSWKKILAGVFPRTWGYLLALCLMIFFMILIA